MVITRKQIQDAFQLLFEGILDPKFNKSLYLESWGERALLPLVRTFLLGYFGELEAEVTSKLPSSLSGKGRLDFLVENVAVEFAVRIPGENPRIIGLPSNYGELIKLTLHNGPAALVLFDFATTSLDDTELDRFRHIPPTGRGHKKSGYSILYYHRSLKRPRRMNVNAS